MNPWPSLSAIVDQRHRDVIRALMKRLDCDAQTVIQSALDLMTVALNTHQKRRGDLYRRMVEAARHNRNVTQIGDVINAIPYAQAALRAQPQTAAHPSDGQRHSLDSHHGKMLPADRRSVAGNSPEPLEPSPGANADD